MGLAFPLGGLSFFALGQAGLQVGALLRAKGDAGSAGPRFELAQAAATQEIAPVFTRLTPVGGGAHELAV